MSDEERTERDDDVLPAARSTFVPSPKPVSNRTYCSSCNTQMAPFYQRCPKCDGDRNRRKVDMLAGVIRELKESITSPLSADRERELVKLLTVYDHPDPDGLIRAIEDKRNAPRTKERRR